MPFNTAISGLRAAGDELKVSANNIANASTSGFKAASAEFSDVYASAVLGTGGNAIGSGTRLVNVAQRFTQGNVAFTSNSLDMAINGNGFFITSDDGALSYTRNGTFSLDKDGQVTSSNGSQVQGFIADSQGNIGGNLESIEISSANLEPSPSTNIELLINVDASDDVRAVRGTTAQAGGTGTSVGIPQAAITNGYGVEQFVFTYPDATTRNITTLADQEASSIASDINSNIPDVSASATTRASLTNMGGTVADLTLTMNNYSFPQGASLNNIAIEINQQTTGLLPGITALVVGTDIQITSNSGVDLDFSISNAGATPISLDVQGDYSAPVATVSLTDDGFGAGNGAVTVGGRVDLTLDEGVVMTGGILPAPAMFAYPVQQNNFVTNLFDPTRQDTFNHSTSATIFDSLGNSHVMSLYYVKESTANQWTMYMRIDDEEVGDPNPALAPPNNILATRASYNLLFNNDGSLDQNNSSEIYVSYWNPINNAGDTTGSLQGLPIAQGGGLPILDPPADSNFLLSLDGSTQFGADFSVNSITQNGYTTGRLSGLDISDEGIIFARYTNGQARVLGQFALANFPNVQGLQPQGGTLWAETFESGQPIVGTPGTAALGVIQAGALEESNVDLSQELVKLIIAQRNYQANAKSIQTADAVTQSIINIR